MRPCRRLNPFAIIYFFFYIVIANAKGQKPNSKSSWIRLHLKNDGQARSAFLQHLDRIQNGCEVLSSTTNGPVDVLCHDAEALKKFANEHNVRHDIVDDDFNRLNHPPSKEESELIDFTEYPRYATIARYLRKMAKEYPDLVKLETIGKTWEGRNVFLIKIGTSPFGNETRAIWTDAGIHAREWIAPVTAIYLIDNIIRRFVDLESGGGGGDDYVTKIDWYFVPLVNPDGYEYSHTNDRLWRKNRSPPPPINKSSSCFGVDLNRNFDVVGFGVGASKDPCQSTYGGLVPNSEPEVKALTENVLKRRDNIRISLSIHSAGSMWLTSWGYKSQKPVDNDKMIALGDQAAKAIRQVNGRKYEVGPAGIVLYPAGGASDDFAKAKAKIPYAVTIELPGDGYQFKLPPEKILGVGQEMLATIDILAQTAFKEPLGPDESYEKERERNKREGTI